jgi:hypothetical protein
MGGGCGDSLRRHERTPHPARCARHPLPQGERVSAHAARASRQHPDSKSQTAVILLAAHPRPRVAPSHRAPLKARGAERRETQDPRGSLSGRRSRPGTLARRAAPRCDPGRAPLGAPLAAIFRSRATLSQMAFAPRSASSWQAGRSTRRVEPRVARIPRPTSQGSRSRASGALPPSAPGIPGLISGPSFRPVPPTDVTG